MSNIQTLPLEEIMGDRFGRYSKYIIQERALPDIRDGLKPVQRRILYSMYRDGNTSNKPYRKSAKSVGNIMGNFHPHGDSSIYEAMLRLSQDWKMLEPLLEIHGNNGSMDGDPPAAMRYTEARLSEISDFLLDHIDKSTVSMAWNFDDTEKEPTVLPASFPNLLVNGSTGISAGYATDIPPHNLGEVVDATIYLIDHPMAKLTKLMEILQGPDFPTGAIIQGREAIEAAYETGKGKIVIRSKTSFESLKGGKQQIVISQIPYEVNKATLVKRIDEVRLSGKIGGIDEVRDESDREGLRIVVELKKEANQELILNYLYKSTDLQMNYNFNMVAIDRMMPRQVGLLEILQSYINFRQEVLIKRSQYDLDRAKTRRHIVEGLIRMVSILDQVVATVRASDNKKDAKENLKLSFAFTEEQAEAIVTLQLYRLTNTDVLILEKEEDQLRNLILELSAIINDEKTLFNVMKKELRVVKKRFGQPRRSELQDQVEMIEITASALVIEEETVVSVTRSGYLKRTPIRSFASSDFDEIGKRPDDQVVFVKTDAKTTQNLLIFTNLGNVIYRPLHELKDMRWKDIGEHLSQTLTNFSPEEEVIFADVFTDFKAVPYLVVTKRGQVKQVMQTHFQPWRTYKAKSTAYVKLKDEDDQVVGVMHPLESSLMLISTLGYALRFTPDQVPVLGAKAAGVKGINLKAGDDLAAAFITDTSSVYLLTDQGGIKRFSVTEIPVTSRGNRGLQVLKTVKKDPLRVFSGGNVVEQDSQSLDLLNSPKTGVAKQILQIETQDGHVHEVDLATLPLVKRTENPRLIAPGIRVQSLSLSGIN